MNTSAVAKLLGVSPSTIQRWVKQANLQMERTELGHYLFSEESIEILKSIQEQLNNGVLVQDLKLKEHKVRKATVVGQNRNDLTEVNRKMNELERQISQKADDIVTYQLLQHRREIEELQIEISRLNELVAGLQQVAAVNELSTKIPGDFPKPEPNRKKKKKLITAIFGF